MEVVSLVVSDVVLLAADVLSVEVSVVEAISLVFSDAVII